MADKYSTIQQHQPLRVPSGWDRQEKMLVVQLDEIFDDIYRRFGRLRTEDLGDKLKNLILLKDDDGNYTSISAAIGEITLEVGNKYDKVSGITINSSGIDIVGDKYVKIESGGRFNVDAENFKISSYLKKIVVGDWTLGQHGLYKEGTKNNVDTILAIGEIASYPANTARATMEASFAISYPSVTVHPILYFTCVGEDNVVHRMGMSAIEGDYGVRLTSTHASEDASYTGITRNALGGPSEFWTVMGASTSGTTRESNFNNITVPGKYYINTYGMTNYPSGFSGYGHLIVNNNYNDGRMLSDIDQILFPSGADIFYRRHYDYVRGWGSWYVFTGTAV